MRSSTIRRGQGRWLAVGLIALLVAGGSAGYIYYRYGRKETPPPDFIIPPVENLEAQVHHFCGGCHAYPPPHTFPKRHWKEEVERGYQFFQQAGKNLRPPPIDDVVKYYVDAAPDELPKIDVPQNTQALPVHFEPIRIPGPPTSKPFAISHVNVVRLSGNKHPDLIVCDMRNGLVMTTQPAAAKPTWKILAKVSHPAHAEVLDLDGDGVLDILVANLGNFEPTDRRCGSVVWLRGLRDGSYQTIPLLEDVGRIADVQAADFRGVGKLDLIVASFGWNNIGEVIYLENETTDWARPKFTPRELDVRHGAIHVPVVDLNGDGKPDFIAVFAQEHESVVAFLNDGQGGFRRETIFRGPDPSYGSSGIQLVDMNADGRLDVLYTNGDTLDAPYLLKPYHSVQWLENPGDGKYPWKHHALTPFYGVHRALAADLCGAGKMDVFAVSFLPVEAFPQREKLKLDAALLLERTGPATFTRHVLESGKCDYTTGAIGDLFGSGRTDLITGVFSSTKTEHCVTIWKNLGRK